MTAINLVLGIVVFFISTSCSTHSDGNVASYLIDNAATAAVQKCDDVFDLRIIDIDEKTSLLVGGTVRDFIPFKDKIVLIDQYANRLTAVDYNGKILWQLRGGEDAQASFTSMFTVRFNNYSKLIEVFDDIRFSVFRYDEFGNFVSKRLENIQFLDRIAVSEQEVLYDLNFNPKAYLDDQRRAYDFALSSDGVDIRKFKRNDNYTPGYVAYVTHDNFNYVDGEVYHHKNFFDTINIVDRSGAVAAYTIRFDHGERSQDIITKAGSHDRVDYIAKESVPYIIQSVPIGNKVFSTYRNGKRKAFHVVDKNGGDVLNSFYLQHGDHIFFAPLVYRQGSFFSLLFDSQTKEFAEAQALPGFSEHFSPDDISGYSPESDMESMRIFILTPKE